MKSENGGERVNHCLVQFNYGHKCQAHSRATAVSLSFFNLLSYLCVCLAYSSANFIVVRRKEMREEVKRNKKMFRRTAKVVPKKKYSETYAAVTTVEFEYCDNFIYCHSINSICCAHGP